MTNPGACATSSDVKAKWRALVLVDPDDGTGIHDHQPVHEPVANGYHDVGHDPAAVVDLKILNQADRSIDGRETELLEIPCLDELQRTSTGERFNHG